MNPPCRIELLGGLRVRLGDRVITRFQTQKTGALLAYLALHAGKSFPRETMAELLWPDGDPGAIRNRLNQAISSLRRQLHPPGSEPGFVLQADHLALQLNSPTVTTDVADFEAHLKAADADEANAPASLRHAVDLYQGEFLDGYYLDWALLERVRLSDLYYDALSRLIRAYAQSGRISEAIEVAIRRLAIDPSDERAHRALMRLYLAAGRPRSALAQYHELARALALDEEVPSERAERLRDEAFATLHAEEPDLEVRAEAPGATVEHVVAPPVESRSLPRYLTKLWGREAELAAISELWDANARIVTLAGFGGIGKTRLAVEAAWQAVDRFGGRVAFVSMAEHSGQESIVEVAAQTLAGDPVEDPHAVFGRWSQGAPSLLVLDNLEEVSDGPLAEMSAALAQCAHVSILATSRHPLDIEGEHVIALRPLPVPNAAQGLSELANNASVALFVDRAQTARQDFQLTERTAEAIGELCARLEGVPLALELAASWARTLTPNQMVEQITSHYDRLSSRRKDIAPRHRSMRAVVDGSYLMLPTSLREGFVRLSVFVGGWDHPAATQICVGVDVFELMREVEELGLVSPVSGERQVRFHMLEIVRAFCRDQMTHDMLAEANNAHAEYYSALVARAIRRGDMTGLPLITEDHANCVAALRYLIEAERYEEAAQLGADLALFWDVSGRLREGAALLEELAQHDALLSTTLRGVLWSRQARLAWRQGDYRKSQELNERAIAVFTEAEDLEYLCETRLQLAREAHRRSDYDRSEAILRENLETIRTLDDLGSEARNLLALGNALVEKRRWDEAAAIFEQSLKLARKVGREHLAAMPLANLGNLEVLRGNLEAGKALIEEARALFERTGFQTYERDCRRMIAKADRELGDPEASLRACQTLLAEPNDEEPMVWSILLEAAYAYAALGEPAISARLMGAVETLWEISGNRAFGIEADLFDEAKGEMLKILGAELESNLAVGRRLDSANWSKILATR